MNLITSVSGFLGLALIVTFCGAKPAEDTRILTMSKNCNAVDADTKIVLQYQVPSSDSGKCLMLCYLKELKMLDSNEKYSESLSLEAFKGFWTQYSADVLQEVNSKAAIFAKGIDSKSGTCDYGYEIMKFINAEFIRKSLLKTPSS
uniref:Odorant-binding protein n=1 Tax=Paracoccus marginatus TaxID=252483 RepID=A0AA51WBV5_9HEMI|nr:odorant-binding protein [Paracoccus marginatus]